MVTSHAAMNYAQHFAVNRLADRAAKELRDVLYVEKLLSGGRHQRYCVSRSYDAEAFATLFDDIEEELLRDNLGPDCSDEEYSAAVNDATNELMSHGAVVGDYDITPASAIVEEYRCDLNDCKTLDDIDSVAASYCDAAAELAKHSAAAAELDEYIDRMLDV